MYIDQVSLDNVPQTFLFYYQSSIFILSVLRTTSTKKQYIFNTFSAYISSFLFLILKKALF